MQAGGDTCACKWPPCFAALVNHWLPLALSFIHNTSSTSQQASLAAMEESPQAINAQAQAARRAAAQRRRQQSSGGAVESPPAGPVSLLDLRPITPEALGSCRRSQMAAETRRPSLAGLPDTALATILASVTPAIRRTLPAVCKRFRELTNSPAGAVVWEQVLKQGLFARGV